MEVFWQHEAEKALENALIISRLFDAMSKEYFFSEEETNQLKEIARWG